MTGMLLDTGGLTVLAAVAAGCGGVVGGSGVGGEDGLGGGVVREDGKFLTLLV